jgi:hypothetical protein
VAIRLEISNIRADGKAVAVGGKAFVRAPNGVGEGYPASGSNQSGNVATAVGVIRLNHDGTIEKFVPDSTPAFEAVVAADTATGTD